MRVQSWDHHRNGVSGVGFDVFLTDDGKVIVSFAGTGTEYEGCTAVLDVAVLARGEIGFGLNSWRGDEFESELIVQGYLPTHFCRCGEGLYGNDYNHGVEDD